MSWKQSFRSRTCSGTLAWLHWRSILLVESNLRCYAMILKAGLPGRKQQSCESERQSMPPQVCSDVQTVDSSRAPLIGEAAARAAAFEVLKCPIAATRRTRAARAPRADGGDSCPHDRFQGGVQRVL